MQRITVTVITAVSILLSFLPAVLRADTYSFSVDTTDGGAARNWKFWGEFYNETTSSQRTLDNLIAFSHIRSGVRLTLGPSLSLESYLLLRYGKDLNKDFWNNRCESAIGLRLRFSRKIFLAYYAELVTGRYLNVPADMPQPAGSRYNDLRTGVIFWYGWDSYRDPVKRFTLPLIWSGEIYSDISYYRRQNNNIIGYCHVKSGFHLLRFWKSTIDIYGAAYINRDMNGEFWNNRLEFGPGLWLKPLESLDMKLYVEWLSGRYISISDSYINPYPQQYTDRRLGLLFWIGW